MVDAVPSGEALHVMGGGEHRKTPNEEGHYQTKCCNRNMTIRLGAILLFSIPNVLPLTMVIPVNLPRKAGVTPKHLPSLGAKLKRSIAV